MAKLGVESLHEVFILLIITVLHFKGSLFSEWKLEMVYVTFWSGGLNQDNVSF